VLEGRSVSSVAPVSPLAGGNPIPVYRADETTLDGLIRLPSWNSAGAAPAADTETTPGKLPASGAPLSVAVFMGVFLGSAAIFEYELEADAQASHAFHGAKV
jgi:hypothetical protein